jgi:putative transposase
VWGDFRCDLFFKLGALLAGEYDVLVPEDLDVQGLIQKGETWKRRLRLYDSSFSELRRILEWEFVKRGKLVLPVPAYNTSRECFQCGEINWNLTFEDRVFRCPHCGFTLDRHLNACLVLLKRSGLVPPAVPLELRPIPPLPSLGLVERGRQGGVMGQEASAFRRG